MTEGEYKDLAVERREDAQEKKKKLFFFGLRNRLLALAAAGFITLGIGWARDLSGQLEIEDKSETIKELILKNEITKDALVDFKIRVEREEPEFIKVLEEYKEAIKDGLDNLEKEIINHAIKSSSHQRYDQQLNEEQQQQWTAGNYEGVDMSWVIDQDHRLISLIQSDPTLLRSGHKFIAENLDDIL